MPRLLSAENGLCSLLILSSSILSLSPSSSFYAGNGIFLVNTSRPCVPTLLNFSNGYSLLLLQYSLPFALSFRPSRIDLKDLESVVTTIVKLCLKSLLEFVRLQTFNRSGFQQNQLDIQFLRAPLKGTVEDEAAIDFLLDEVIVGTSERCLDPILLEPPILDKLIQAKLAKKRELNAITP